MSVQNRVPLEPGAALVNDSQIEWHLVATVIIANEVAVEKQ